MLLLGLLRSDAENQFCRIYCDYEYCFGRDDLGVEPGLICITNLAGELSGLESTALGLCRRLVRSRED
jgi:hypothetical protein